MVGPKPVVLGRMYYMIHANGNKPKVIRRILSFIEDERDDIIAKKWLRLDMRKRIVEQGDNEFREIRT